MSTLKWDRRGAEAFDTRLLQAAFDNQMKAYAGIGDVGKIFDESMRANKELALKEQLMNAQIAESQARINGKGYYSKTGSGDGVGTATGSLADRLYAAQGQQQVPPTGNAPTVSAKPVTPITENMVNAAVAADPVVAELTTKLNQVADPNIQMLESWKQRLGQNIPSEQLTELSGLYGQKTKLDQDLEKTLEYKLFGGPSLKEKDQAILSTREAQGNLDKQIEQLRAGVSPEAIARFNEINNPESDLNWELEFRKEQQQDTVKPLEAKLKQATNAVFDRLIPKNTDVPQEAVKARNSNDPQAQIQGDKAENTFISNLAKEHGIEGVNGKYDLNKVADAISNKLYATQDQKVTNLAQIAQIMPREQFENLEMLALAQYQKDFTVTNQKTHSNQFRNAYIQKVILDYVNGGVSSKEEKDRLKGQLSVIEKMQADQKEAGKDFNSNTSTDIVDIEKQFGNITSKFTGGTGYLSQRLDVAGSGPDAANRFIQNLRKVKKDKSTADNFLKEYSVEDMNNAIRAAMKQSQNERTGFWKSIKSGDWGDIDFMEEDIADKTAKELFLSKKGYAPSKAEKKDLVKQILKAQEIND